MVNYVLLFLHQYVKRVPYKTNRPFPTLTRNASNIFTLEDIVLLLGMIKLTKGNIRISLNRGSAWGLSIFGIDCSMFSSLSLVVDFFKSPNSQLERLTILETGFRMSSKTIHVDYSPVDYSPVDIVHTTREQSFEELYEIYFLNMLEPFLNIWHLTSLTRALYTLDKSSSCPVITECQANQITLKIDGGGSAFFVRLWASNLIEILDRKGQKLLEFRLSNYYTLCAQISTLTGFGPLQQEKDKHSPKDSHKLIVPLADFLTIYTIIRLTDASAEVVLSYSGLALNYSANQLSLLHDKQYCLTKKKSTVYFHYVSVEQTIAELC